MDTRVSLERLDVDNYAPWSVRMRFTLISRGLWKHVINDGEVTDTDGDQKALALIGLSVMDHHLPSLGQRETAKAAWDALESVYKAKSMARRVALKREMNSLKKAAEEPMTKYVARAKELRDQLAAAGHTTNDEEVAAALLAGLPPDYDVIVAVLETTADKVDLDVLLGKLLTAEQRLPNQRAGGAPGLRWGGGARASRWRAEASATLLLLRPARPHGARLPQGARGPGSRRESGRWRQRARRGHGSRQARGGGWLGAGLRRVAPHHQRRLHDVGHAPAGRGHSHHLRQR